jgi:hypothetical protein
MLLAKYGALRERSTGKRMSKGQTFGRKLAGYLATEQLNSIRAALRKSASQR